MYSQILKKIETIAVFLTVYVFPVVLVAMYLSAYFDRLPYRGRSAGFAQMGR